MRKIVPLIGVAAALLAAAPAQAEDVLERAGETLRLDPVYVAPDAEFGISDDEADDLRAQIPDDDATPLFIAVLPASADDGTGDDPVAALREVADKANEPGVYAAVIGKSFRAGATRDELSGAEVGALARAAIDSHRPDGTAAVLSDFVRRVGKARDAAAASPSGNDGDEGGGGSVWLLVLGGVVAVVALLGWLGRRRRLREEAFELERARSAARDDVITLGEEIRALDMDMDLPEVDAQAKQRYGEAVECYQQAERELEEARRPEDLEGVAEEVAAGKRAMAAARAWLEGAAT